MKYSINILLFILYSFISLNLKILIHEMGHLIMSILVKVKVESLIIGSGKVIYRFQFFNTLFILKNMISITDLENGYQETEVHFIGRCLYDKSFDKLPKIKQILILSAGMIMDFLMFVVFFFIFINTKNYFSIVFSILSLILFLRECFPRGNNDIKNILDILNNNNN